MIVLRAAGIRKELRERVLLRDVTLQVNSGDKLGLIGANGCGKTTLLRILLGLAAPTAGSVMLADDVRVGYVPQHVTVGDDVTVADYVLAECRERGACLRTAEERLAHAAPDALDKAMRAYQVARDAFEHVDGDHAEARARRTLEVFGLGQHWASTVVTLSGGEQNLAALTKALLARPDLLVLDEPANHLDYIGIAWLEDFLAGFRGAVLMVSHNRYLLDRVTNGIVEISNGTLTRYRGNYSAYREQKLRAQLSQQRAHEAYQKQLARVQALVQRFADLARVHSSWGTRYRARQSQLAHLQAQAVAAPEAAARSAAMRFGAEATHANIVLRVSNYHKQYDDRVILRDVSFELTSGERVALVGPNGSGKTSLLRDIIAQAHWDNPTLRIGPSIAVGYCAQQQEVLHPERTLVEEMMAAGTASRQAALDMLARFLFRGDDVEKRVRHLSGGERNRLQLARLMVLNPNFMILDEPTNHLDIDTCEAVEGALDDYRGTLLVVSHDRYFLDTLVARVLEVRDQTIVSYPGSYSEFWYERTARASAPPVEEPARTAPRPRPAAPGVRPAGKKKLEQQCAALEQQIRQLEQERNDTEHAAADAYAAGEHQRGQALAARTAALSTDINVLYEQWLTLQDEGAGG
jgi:ATP-binding cassette subfamily F protein 3